jgi:hypothetical protein
MESGKAYAEVGKATKFTNKNIIHLHLPLVKFFFITLKSDI